MKWFSFSRLWSILRVRWATFYVLEWSSSVSDLSSQTELLVVRIWYKSRESGILLFDQNFILNLRVLRWQRYTRVRIVTAHAIIETVHPSFFVVVDLLSAASVESSLNFPANKIESSWRCTEDINPILRIGNINCFFGTFFRQNICSFS